MGDTGFNMNRMLGGDPTGQKGFAGMDMDLAKTDIGKTWEGVKEVPMRLQGLDPSDVPDVPQNDAASNALIATLITLGIGGGASGIGSMDWGGMAGGVGDWFSTQAGSKGMGMLNPTNWTEPLGFNAWDATKSIAGTAGDIMGIMGMFGGGGGGGQGQEMPSIQDIYGDISSPGGRGSLSQMYNLGGEGGSDNIYGGTDPKLMALIAALMSQGKGKKTIS